MLFPARLRVVSDGKVQFFEDPQAILSWLERRGISDPAPHRPSSHMHRSRRLPEAGKLLPMLCLLYLAVSGNRELALYIV